MRKKRIVLLSACGLLVTSLTASFLFPVKVRSAEITIPLFHHHSEACLGEVVRRQESDDPGILGVRYEDVCPLCGGALHGYGYNSHCSCGESWYSEGYACFNSSYGSNPGGGCPNYSPVNFDTLHDHVCIENVCGKDEEYQVGEVSIGISTTDPASMVTLSATYTGELETPELNWEETGELPEEDTPDGEDNREDVDEGEADKAAEDESPESVDSEEIEEPEDPVEPEETPTPTKLGSSITVEKNGIYTLVVEYEEDGLRYTASRSVTIGNIIKPEPPAPEAPVQEEPAAQPVWEPEEEVPEPEEVIEPEVHLTKVSPAVLVKEPEEEEVEEIDEVPEVMQKVEEVKETPEVPLPEPVPMPKEPKKKLWAWYSELPTPVKVATTVSASALVGGLIFIYTWLILFRTAKVKWIDEEGRGHFLARAFIRRKSTGFAVTLRRKDVLSARCDEFSILLPGAFAAIYHYQPISLWFEERMYSLHVEREIRISQPG